MILVWFRFRSSLEGLAGKVGLLNPTLVDRRRPVPLIRQTKFVEPFRKQIAEEGLAEEILRSSAVVAPRCAGFDVRIDIAASPHYERQIQKRTSFIRFLVSLLVLTFANESAAK